MTLLFDSNDIQFDDVTSDNFIKQAILLKNELSSQRLNLQNSANVLFPDFVGAYAELMKVLIEQQKVDNSRAVTALDKLTRLLKFAKIRANEERERIKRHRLWEQRNPTSQFDLRPPFRPLQFGFSDKSVYSRGNSSGIDSLICREPEPPNVPLTPPVVSVNFTPTKRQHKATKSSVCVTSANPAVLRDFVRAAERRNSELHVRISSFHFWGHSFANSCSWVRTDLSDLFRGLDLFREQNMADADLLAGIASAFEHADSKDSSGTLFDIADISLTSFLEAAPRYRSTSAFSIQATLSPSRLDDFMSKLKDGNIRLTAQERVLIPRRGTHIVGLAETFAVNKKLEEYERRLSRLSKQFNSNIRFLKKNRYFVKDYKLPGMRGWVKPATKILGPLSIGLTYWGEYSNGYQNDLKKHPEWSESKRQDNAFKYSAVVGTTSVVSSGAGAWAGGLAGAAAGSAVPIIGTGLGAVVGAIGGALAASDFGKRAGKWIWNNFFGK